MRKKETESEDVVVKQKLWKLLWIRMEKRRRILKNKQGSVRKLYLVKRSSFDNGDLFPDESSAAMQKYFQCKILLLRFIVFRLFGDHFGPLPLWEAQHCPIAILSDISLGNCNKDSLILLKKTEP